MTAPRTRRRCRVARESTLEGAWSSSVATSRGSSGASDRSSASRRRMTRGNHPSEIRGFLTTPPAPRAMLSLPSGLSSGSEDTAPPLLPYEEPLRRLLSGGAVGPAGQGMDADPLTKHSGPAASSAGRRSPTGEPLSVVRSPSGVPSRACCAGRAALQRRGRRAHKRNQPLAVAVLEDPSLPPAQPAGGPTVEGRRRVDRDAHRCHPLTGLLASRAASSHVADGEQTT